MFITGSNVVMDISAPLFRLEIYGHFSYMLPTESLKVNSVFLEYQVFSATILCLKFMYLDKFFLYV